MTEIKLSLGFSLVFYILITSIISFLLGLNISKKHSSKIKIKKVNKMYLEYVKQIPKAHDKNNRDRKKCESILKQFKASNCKYAEVKYAHNEYKTSDSLASTLFRINKDLKYYNIKIIRRSNKVFLVNTEAGTNNEVET